MENYTEEELEKLEASARAELVERALLAKSYHSPLEGIVLIICVVFAGYCSWKFSQNVLLTIGAVILGGFVGSLIGFLIHMQSCKKIIGVSSIRELREIDRALGGIL